MCAQDQEIKDKAEQNRSNLEDKVRETVQALSHSEHVLNLSQEMAHLGNWELDLDNDSLSWSDEVYRIFGLQPQEFEATYEAFLEAIHPDDREAVDAAYSRSVKEGRDTYEIEHRVICKSTGEVRYVHEKCQHIKDRSGKIIRSIGIVHDITESKKIEETLKKQEEKFRVIADFTYNWEYWINPDRNFVYVSPSCERLTGYTTEEFTRDSNLLLNIIHPDDRSSIIERHFTDLSPGEPHGLEFRIVRKNGQERWISHVCQPVIGKDGKYLGRRASNADITARKIAEEEVRKNEERLERFVRISQHGGLNEQELLEYALEEAIYLTESKIGYVYHYDEERQEFVLNSWSREVLAKECTIRKPQTVYQLQKTGIWGEAVRQRRPIIVNDFQAPHPFKRGYPAGHAELYKFLTVPVFSGNKLVAVVGVANKQTDYDQVDISQLSLLMDSIWKVVERKRTEEALGASEKRYRSFIELTGELGWVTNAEGKVDEDIPSFRRYTGQTYEEVKDWGWLKALHPDDTERTKEIWTKAVIEKTSYEVEYRLRRYDGKYRYFLARGVPVLAENGNVKEWVGTCFDITERKQLEALKDEFIGMVSHELKTPLTVIIGALNVADAEGIKPDERKELIHDAAISAEMLASIVENLLELSRHQSNRLGLQTKWAQIEPLVRGVVERFRNRSYVHQFIIDVPSELPPIMIDTVRIERVLNNLVDNAIKYSPKGSNVRIFSHHTDGQLVIGVSDQGIGISPEDQTRLFETFQRLGVQDKYGIVGVGLGLRVCRILVETHGGHMWVESELGKGSTFFFSLPTVETNQGQK